MNFEKQLRKLAKTTEHQNLFSLSKDIVTIKLFKNNRDLSKLQQFYLSYLYFYHDLYLDVELKKVNSKVLDYEIYEDAYKLWKKEKPEDISKKDKAKDVHLVFTNNKPKRGKK